MPAASAARAPGPATGESDGPARATGLPCGGPGRSRQRPSRPVVPGGRWPREDGSHTQRTAAAAPRSTGSHSTAMTRRRCGTAALRPRRGTLTAVLGGSGSGKSTLGKLLAGWLRAGHAGRSARQPGLGGSLLEFHGESDDPRDLPRRLVRPRGLRTAGRRSHAVLGALHGRGGAGLRPGKPSATPRAGMLRQVARTTAERTGSRLLERTRPRSPAANCAGSRVGCAVIAHPGRAVLRPNRLASLDAAGRPLASCVNSSVDGLLDAGTAVVLLSQSADALARSAGHWIVLDAGTVTAEGPPAEPPGGRRFQRSPGLLAERQGCRVAENATARARPAPAATGRWNPGTVPRFWRSGGRPSRYHQAPCRRKPAARPGTCSSHDLDLAAAGRGDRSPVPVPNGAGKSTLLRHLNGLLLAAAGEVLVLAVTKYGRHSRRDASLADGRAAVPTARGTSFSNGPSCGRSHFGLRSSPAVKPPPRGRRGAGRRRARRCIRRAPGRTVRHRRNGFSPWPRS